MHGCLANRLNPLALAAALWMGWIPCLGTAQEPVTPPPIIARVNGTDIPAHEKAHLSNRITKPLLDQFAKENGISATETEVDAFVDWLGRITAKMEVHQKEEIKKLEAELSTGALVEAERKLKEKSLEALRRSEEFDRQAKEISKGHEEQIREGMRQMARSRVVRWKTFKALYDRYGGRVIFQQGGPEPLDALRDFLKEQEQAGAFKILDPEEAARFWRYYTDDQMHHFFPEAEGKRAILTPMWMQQPPHGE